MKNSIWNGPAPSSVHSQGGLKTTGQYSGLYQPENETPKSAVWKFGDEAAEHAKETERRLLNEGEDFAGHIEERQFGVLKIWVRNHQTLGVVVYPQIPASYENNKIEVCHGDGLRQVLSRSEFFAGLLHTPPSDGELALVLRGMHGPLSLATGSKATLILRDLTRRRPE